MPPCEVQLEVEPVPAVDPPQLLQQLQEARPLLLPLPALYLHHRQRRLQLLKPGADGAEPLALALQHVASTRGL